MSDDREPEVTAENSLTLDQWIVSMIESKKTAEPAFQSCLNYWGKARVLAIWKRHQESKRAQGQSPAQRS